MKILVSNDDGYQATGIRVLAEHLATLGEVTVVAPERDRSGASNSLTLDIPLRAEELEPGRFRVNGTPTDCVHIAVYGMLESQPDMVVSGINAGANLGDDVIYSGTVAAAMEGRHLGYPAIAVSLVGHPPTHYDTAGRVVAQLVRRMQEQSLPPESILNVNVPDVPYDELTGFEVTRLGFRHRAEPVVRQTDPRGRTIYWIGIAGPEQDAGPGTDFYAVRQKRVSITPIHLDLTRHGAVAGVRDWLATGGLL